MHLRGLTRSIPQLEVEGTYTNIEQENDAGLCACNPTKLELERLLASCECQGKDILDYSTDKVLAIPKWQRQDRCAAFPQSPTAANLKWAKHTF